VSVAPSALRPPVAPDVQQATDFVCSMAGQGRLVCLTGIKPDTGIIVARTFVADADRDLVKSTISGWVAQGFNVHFNINQPTHDRDERLSKADIASAHYLHCDLDPRAGEDPVAELQRLVTLVTTGRPAELPPPTAIWCSGGGVQVAWRLTEPVILNGDVTLAEEFERYNVQIENVLRAANADTCHDVSRILRVPGTTNLPNAKKRAKGRMPAPAYLIELDEGRLYDLSEFRQAPPKGGASSPTRGGVVVDISEGRRIADVAELDRWGVSDRVKVVIAQGHDPENPKEGDNNRSAWLFDALCQLSRAGVDDETIFGIITDPTCRSAKASWTRSRARRGTPTARSSARGTARLAPTCWR
jgi:hypothetical protein